MKTGTFINKRLEETQVIDLLIENSICQYGSLNYFYNVTNVPRKDDLKFDRYYITKEILRQEIGLAPGQKPGDIDILIIPASGDKIFFEFSSAFELKVVRPTNKDYRKNSNSLGTTQTLGLIKDGFPLVGLIQVCMNEPINPVHLQYLPNFENVSEIFTFDPFPIYSVETQYKRVLKTDLPKYVGINIFGLSFTQEFIMVTQHSMKFTGFQEGYFNPNTKQSTIKSIENHFKQHRELYIEKVNTPTSQNIRD
ncbi:MAG: hypothetical protein IBJ09_02455 [Bacteroidia bacterium]|nr:hypothetical protein [Bacteroidia bacterium]